MSLVEIWGLEPAEADDCSDRISLGVEENQSGKLSHIRVLAEVFVSLRVSELSSSDLRDVLAWLHSQFTLLVDHTVLEEGAGRGLVEPEEHDGRLIL